MSIHKIQDEYRRAVEQSRQPNLTAETENRLVNTIIAKRHELDSALIEQHEDESSRSGGVSPEEASRIVRGSTGHSTAGQAELRSFMTPGSPLNQYWVTPPREQVMGPASKFTRAAFLTTDTATIGSAYYFTSELYSDVVMGLVAASGVLEAEPTVIVTNHLRDIQVPVLTADATATAGVEGSPATEANPTGDAVTLGHYRYDGAFKVPIEMVMSAEYDLPSLLSTFATRSIANKVAAELAMGNGTTAPQGLFVGATVGKTSSSTSPTSNELIQLTKSVGKGYRKNARMVVSDALHTLMLEWTNDDGDYLMRSIESGGYQFAGKNLFTEPQADQSGLSAAEVHAVYGDVSGYFVRLTPMLFQRRDDDPLNPVFTFAIWADARVADAASVRSLKTP